MSELKIHNTGFYSYSSGDLTSGCKMCVEGKKLVLFITGVCPRKCWYCPISDSKVQTDVIYANETKIDDVTEAIKEAKLSNASGAGITGGDPLTRLNRTIIFIKALKKEFGKEFHIHLYTSFNLVTESTMEALYNSGLDEIRFHPDLMDNKFWNRIDLPKKFNWKVGIEIPCIPDYEEQTFKVLNYFKDKVDFFNLNELEAADSLNNKVFEKGYVSKDKMSYGIKGSKELAFKIMKTLPEVNVHFCTSRLKNFVQLGNRIKNRAKNIAKSFDIITDEGSLIRGVIFLEKPSFNHTELIKSKDKNQELVRLNLVLENVCKELKLSPDLFSVDDIKYRILASKQLIIKNKSRLKKMGLFPAIVEELATGDLFDLDIEFL
jgi:hypothetical protein